MASAHPTALAKTTPVRQIPQWNYLNIIFYVFVFSLSFEMVNIAGEGNGISVARIIFPVYVVAFFVSKHTALSGKAFALAAPALFILLIAAASSLGNLYGSSDRITDTSIIFCIILFVLVVSHQERYKNLLTESMLYFSYGAVALALLSLAGFGTEYDTDGRLTIFGDNSNLVGLRMSIACSVFAFVIMQGGRNKFFYIALGAGFLAAFSVMITTGSRIAFISLCLALLILIWSRVTSIKTLLLHSVAMIFGSYSIFWYLFMTDNVLIDRLVKSYTERHTAGRESVWNLYLGGFRYGEGILFGKGFAGFDNLSLRLFGRILSPHNVLLEVFLLAGFVGLAFFFFLNVKALVAALRVARKERFVLPLMLLSQYFGALLTAQTLNNKFMWLILAICFIPRGLAMRERKAPRLAKPQDNKRGY